MVAFPNRGGGHDDVIWEPRGRDGFISYHRVFNNATHLGHWTYGPPTGKEWANRGVAHCLVQDNKVVEEWVIRDEYAVLEHLGIDPLPDRRRACASVRRCWASRCRPTPRPARWPAASRTRWSEGISGRPPGPPHRGMPLDRAHVRGGLEPAAVRPRRRILRRHHRLPDGAHAPGDADRTLSARADDAAVGVPRRAGGNPRLRGEPFGRSRPAHRRDLAAARHLQRLADVWAGEPRAGEASSAARPSKSGAARSSANGASTTRSR